MQFYPWWHSGTHSCPSSSLLHNFFPSGTVGPAFLLLLSQWYSRTNPCQTSSLHSYLSLVAQWDSFMPWFFPTSKFYPYWHSGTKVFPTYKFVPGGTMRPIPAKFLPYFTMSSIVTQTCLLDSSSIVVQWDPPLPNLFPTCLLSSSSQVVQWDPVLPNYLSTCKFIHGGTVEPNSTTFLPYFTISFLVAQ